jgi:hypothetical protein
VISRNSDKFYICFGVCNLYSIYPSAWTGEAKRGVQEVFEGGREQRSVTRHGRARTLGRDMCGSDGAGCVVYTPSRIWTCYCWLSRDARCVEREEGLYCLMQHPFPTVTRQLPSSIYVVLSWVSQGFDSEPPQITFTCHNAWDTCRTWNDIISDGQSARTSTSVQHCTTRAWRRLRAPQLPPQLFSFSSGVHLLTASQDPNNRRSNTVLWKDKTLKPVNSDVSQLKVRSDQFSCSPPWVLTSVVYLRQYTTEGIHTLRCHHYCSHRSLYQSLLHCRISKRLITSVSFSYLEPLYERSSLSQPRCRACNEIWARRPRGSMVILETEQIRRTAYIRLRH